MQSHLTASDSTDGALMKARFRHGSGQEVSGSGGGYREQKGAKSLTAQARDQVACHIRKEQNT